MSGSTRGFLRRVSCRALSAIRPGGDLAGYCASGFLTLMLAFASIMPASSANNVTGAWLSPTADNWPLIALHAVLTPDGRVLSYGTDGVGTQTGYFIYDVWNPAQGLSNGHITLQNMTLTDIFCSSQIILPQSGNILLVGGDIWTGTSTSGVANNNSNIFSPADAALSRGTNMNKARWYASTTVMMNGEIYIQGGNSGGDVPEVRQLDGNFRLLSAVNTSALHQQYPRNFLAPDGRVFGFDQLGKMYYVNPSGTGTITMAGQFASAYAGFSSSSAMFRPDKILQMGGNSNGAIVIDITGSQPVVTPTQSMSSQRQWVTATVLPDGRVLATGGSAVYNELTGVNNSAEIWNPANGQWTVGASGSRARLYHSTALLLPDASVLVAGGGAPGPLVNLHAEIYYPPYLYDTSGNFAARPAIVTAPDTIYQGQAFSVGVGTATISRVTLVKTGSETHSVNMDQRFVEMAFTASSGTLFVQMPSSATALPPGYYHLFVIDDKGVPSRSKIVRMNLGSAQDTTPPTQPASLTAAAISSSSIGLGWNAATDNFGVAGYRIFRGGVQIGTTTGTSYTDSGLAAGTTYSYTVAAFDAAGNQSTQSAAAGATTAAGGSVQYSNQDIGTVGVAGSASLSGSVYTVRGSGADIWLTADAFHFVWWPLTGDGRITARLVSQTNTDPWAKAGLMLRESLTAGSRNAAVLVTPSNGIVFQYRTATSGISGPEGTGNPAQKAPYWLRLVRQGATVIGYISPDGAQWTELGRVTLTGLPSTVYVGLPVTSHNNTTISTAQFDNVSVVPDSPANSPPSVTSPGNQTTTAGTAVSLAIQASDPNGDTLTFTATGLPAGLAIASSTGVISGTPTTAGTSTVTVSVSDGSATSTAIFTWTIQSATPLVLNPMPLQPARLVNTAGTYTAVSSGGVNPQYRWYFDDGTETGWSSSATVTHTYSRPSIYWVTVTVKDDRGLQATQTFSQLIHLPLTAGQPSASSSIRLSGDRLWAVNEDNDSVSVFGTIATPQNADVGTVGVAGSTSISGSVYTVRGSGADIWSTADGFQFAWWPLSGDGEITARLVSQTNADPWAKAGLMVRESLAAGSRHAALLVTPANGIVFQYRAATNGASGPDGTGDPAQKAPYWLRLVRQGTTVIGYISPDGVQWTERGRVSLAGLPSSVYVGLPVTSHNNTTSSTAQFDGVNIRWGASAGSPGSLQKLAEVSVANAPRTLAVAPNGEAWITNLRSASISIIDPSSLLVARTISLPAASRPYGIVAAPDGSAVYVALEGLGRVLKLDPATGNQTGAVNVGPNPRHLSLTADGTRLLVSRFITPPLPGESTANITATAADTQHGGEVVVVDSASMTVVSTVVLRHSDDADFENSGGGIPNYVGAAVISPDGSSAWAPSKKDNVKRGTLRSGANLNHQNTVRAISSRIDLGSLTETFASRVDHDNASMASTAAFDRYGVFLFVALETSREVAVVDANNHTEFFRINVGRAPRGLAVSADGYVLYVHNFMDRSVSAYDLHPLVDQGRWEAPLLATLQSVATEKLSPSVLIGKQFFYDARDTRLAREGYMSCASCHNDGGHDGRVWDLTGLGEGLRNTIALRGKAGAQGRLHWTANFDEVQDFEGQIRTLAGGTGLMSDADFNVGTRKESLGDPKTGVSAELDALAAYVVSLNEYPVSPYRGAGGSLTTEGVAGRSVYQNRSCAQCHGGTAFSDSGTGTLHDIGTIRQPTTGHRLGGPVTGLDTPSLRDAWATAPYLHDGSAATLRDAVAAHQGMTLSSGDLDVLVAYLLQIDGIEPAPAAPPPDTTAPTMPAGLSATASGSSQINLSWTASTDDREVAGYRVFRGGTQIATTTATSYSDTGLNAGTSYSYTVTAFDAAGNQSAQSAAGSATTAPPPDTTAPTVPAGLSATASGTSQINLGWTASTDDRGVAGYRVFRGGTQIATTTATGYSDTGLNAGTSYSYTVAAFDAAGNQSAQSAAASATTATPPDTTAPTVPAGLSATASGTSQINLSWNASSDATGVAGYRVFRGGTQIATTTATGYSDTGLNAGTSYSYTVAAFDAAGNQSTQSAAAGATTAAGGSVQYTNQDIGTVGVAGSASLSGSVYTVRGSGADIWLAADAFHFVWWPLAGDGRITARVVSQTNTNAWAKAGLMLRESLTAGSRNAAVLVTPSNGIVFQYRTATNGISGPEGTGNPAQKAPYWLRLVRQGTTVIGYMSPDGVQWTERGRVTLTGLPSTVYVGLPVTSHKNTTSSTAKFDNVSVAPN